MGNLSQPGSTPTPVNRRAERSQVTIELFPYEVLVDRATLVDGLSRDKEAE